jgi:rhodanese-related sulfurtransferase
MLVLTACGKSSKEEEGSSDVIESLSPSEFEARIPEGGVLLDVRTPEEFQTGFIEGATNLDYRADGFEQKLDTLDKSKSYFVYCASGGRSAKAAEIMQAKGFTSIVTLDGGMNAWTAEGHPVQK